MKKVTTVELGGVILPMNEDAYLAVRRYLDVAEKRLEGNPDRSEIVADLERSIAEKLSRRGDSHKTIGREEVVGVLREIGGVNGEDFERAAATGEYSPTRRLFRIHDGKHLSGLCAGLAAYAGMDATWVRVLLVLLALFSGGFLLIVYLIAMFIVPLARTPAEIAAAHGRTAS